ncbi:MAG: PEP-CTERM sorting domain-containing protein [Thiobacillus sp.]|nr:PEP-CTERM sorting domain-containing protein [Thiobacillus sp.]
MKNQKFERALVGALFTAGLMFSSTVFAVASTTYNFVGVTSTNAANVATGMASLSVEVIDLNATQVAFKFTNTSGSSLTDVYFDDGTLLGFAFAPQFSAGVDFSQGASPGNLPGGNNLSPDFTSTVGFNADSNPPTSPNGVTSGEWLTITFDLQPTQTYASVISALALPNGGGTGDLRIGLHVQSFSNGGSESFVNAPTPVPEADAYVMLLAGLGLVGFAVRRQSV